MINNTIKEWLGEFSVFGNYLMLVGILAIAAIAYLIAKKILIKIAKKISLKSKTKFDNHLLESKVIERLTLIIPILIFYYTVYIFPDWKAFLNKTTAILIVFVASFSLSALLSGLNAFYSSLEVSKTRPIKGYIQVITIIVYLIAMIFMIGIITGESAWELLAGLGALTAVLLLIFRDTILSFVASLQIAGNDLVHVGDWIEMPKYGADGDVIDIALHTIKIQNWDKTITVIPTHKLIEESFKNWRGMTAAGGRRIKRSIFIDLNTITFCSEEMLDRYEKINLIADYVKSKRKEISQNGNITDSELINREHLTNIGTFRIYAQNYAKSHPKVHKELTCMVRQLAPGPSGLPLEIYLFTNDTEWINYEIIQADIFDHLLAVIKEFGLKVYQQPSGQDLSRIQYVPLQS